MFGPNDLFRHMQVERNHSDHLYWLWAAQSVASLINAKRQLSWEAQTSQFIHLLCESVGDRTPASRTPSGHSNHYATQGQQELLVCSVCFVFTSGSHGVPIHKKKGSIERWYELYSRGAILYCRSADVLCSNLVINYQGCVQYRNSWQTFRNSHALEIGNFQKRLQTFLYWTQPQNSRDKPNGPHGTVCGPLCKTLCKVSFFAHGGTKWAIQMRRPSVEYKQVVLHNDHSYRHIYFFSLFAAGWNYSWLAETRF